VSAGPVIVDTGPLVALLNRREEHHEWVKATLRDIRPPLLTCEAVIAEATYLLRRLDPGARALMALLERQAVKVAFRLDDEHEPVGRLMAKYTDVPMSLADACLVRMSENVARARVMTFDGDFSVYRRAGRQVVPVMMPTVRQRR
jgi:predicted nucleic acid-binding protein